MNTAAVVIGSLFAAILAYVFQVVGGRALGAVDFAPITVLWTVQFLAIQVLYQPLEHLVNRETRAMGVPSVAAVMRLGALAASLAMLATLPVLDRYLAGDLRYVALAGVLVFAYAPFGYVRGRLAGSGRFLPFAVVTSGEAALRLVLAVPLVAAGAIGLALAMAAAPLAALPYLSRGGSGSSPRASSLGPLVGASMFAQGLLGLAPLAVGAFGAPAAVVSVVFMTFAMYRGPLWVLQGLSARVLPVFVDHVDADANVALRRWAGRLLSATSILSLLAIVVGAMIGPSVFSLLLGEEFRPAPGFSAAVAGGVVLAACGGILNQILLALNRLNVITGAWAAGFAVAVIAAVVVPAAPDVKVGIAFLIGETTACVALFLACNASLKGRLDESSRAKRGRADVPIPG